MDKYELFRIRYRLISGVNAMFDGNVGNASSEIGEIVLVPRRVWMIVTAGAGNSRTE